MSKAVHGDPALDLLGDKLVALLEQCNTHKFWNNQNEERTIKIRYLTAVLNAKATRQESVLARKRIGGAKGFVRRKMKTAAQSSSALPGRACGEHS